MARMYIENENWEYQSWETWQTGKLTAILDNAVRNIPFYRQICANGSIKGETGCLSSWPILEKESVRQNPYAFLAEGTDTKRMFHEHTSGTTGKSLDLWWSKKTVREWYALFEARCRLWHGISRHNRWAILGGQLVTPIRQKKPPFWVWNQALNQLYLSSYHLSPTFIPSYLDALNNYRVEYLWGYTSALYALAIEALKTGRKDLKMKVALTNAEPVFDYQRQAISEAFHCPVHETYGMAEIVAAASECEAGSLHLWPEVGIVEVIENGQPAPLGTTGELICTGLLNWDMPLIRYRTGDRGALEPPDKTCPCGRKLPILKSIEGRIDDVLYTADGRQIGRLDPAFKAHLPVVEAQIIQESFDQIRVRYVPGNEFTQKDGNSIIERLSARLGDVQVILEPVSEIPREKNGKFRAVICEIPEAEKRRILQGKN